MGDDVTISFRTVHDSLWECTWYEMPLSSQKIFPMILAAAQKPVYIEGYLNTQCTRESVKKVQNSIKLEPTNNTFLYLILIVVERCCFLFHGVT